MVNEKATQIQGAVPPRKRGHHRKSRGGTTIPAKLKRTLPRTPIGPKKLLREGSRRTETRRS